jgi:hypothetical protein
VNVWAAGFSYATLRTRSRGKGRSPSKAGNTFLNIGAAYPNQTFTDWIPPASPVSKSPMLSAIEGKRVKITGRIELYEGKPEIRINAAS